MKVFASSTSSLVPSATAVGPVSSERIAQRLLGAAERPNRLFFTGWYSTPFGRSLRRRSCSSATVRPRYSVTITAVERSRSLRRPPTALAFAGTPPPLRFVFGPVLTFAMCPPSCLAGNEKAFVQADEGHTRGDAPLWSLPPLARRAAVRTLSGTRCFGDLLLLVLTLVGATPPPTTGSVP